MRGGAIGHPRSSGQSRQPTISVQSETLLTKRERKQIDLIIFEYRVEGGEPPVNLLDYRWWEIRRKTGWQPFWTDAKWGTVYQWWIQLAPEDRAELVELSRAEGVRDDG